LQSNPIMQNNAIAQKAIDEVVHPNFAATAQFLAVHDLAYKGGQPEIVMIDDKKEDSSAKVYFAVKGEDFYWVVLVETKPEVAVAWVYTEDHCSIYLAAFSTTMNLEELSALTILKPLRSWNKGDVRKPYQAPRKNSAIFIEPNPGPGLFEDKLDKLLDLLEQDKQGVAKLEENGDTRINVAITAIPCLAGLPLAKTP